MFEPREGAFPLLHPVFRIFATFGTNLIFMGIWVVYKRIWKEKKKSSSQLVFLNLRLHTAFWTQYEHSCLFWDWAVDHNDVLWIASSSFFSSCSKLFSNESNSLSVSFILLLLRGKRGGGNKNCLLFVLSRIRLIVHQNLSVSVLYCLCESVATFMMNSFGHTHLWFYL